MPKGITVAEECHIVLATAPIDINSSGADSDVWSMKDHAHASILCLLGVTGAATTITVEECDDFTPTNSTAIAFAYYAEETAGGDVLGAKATATTSGITGSTEDGVIYAIEIDADDLTDGYPCLRVCASDPSAATLYACVAILSGSRYAKTENATQIA